MISDDDDDSFISSDTESEGGFGDANADDNGSNGAIPNEGAQGPNFAVDGEGHRRSTRQVDPIDKLVPGANNIQGYPCRSPDTGQGQTLTHQASITRQHHK